MLYVIFSYKTEQYFPNVQINADVFYYVNDCDQLSDPQHQTLKEQFLQFLHDKGVCQPNTVLGCGIEELHILCGPDEDIGHERTRRAAEVKQLKFRFNLKVKEVSMVNVNCSVYCESSNATTSQYCIDKCINIYNIEAKNILQNGALKLIKSFADTSAASQDDLRNAGDGEMGVEGFHLNNVTLLKQAGIRVGDLQEDCPPGMMLQHHMCCKCCYFGVCMSSILIM